MERTPSGFANALEIFHQCSITAADADPTRGARNASFIAKLFLLRLLLEEWYERK
jgi:hypothetical protein